jgi:glycosyltransferase involved in cell wall biosynthesis
MKSLFYTPVYNEIERFPTTLAELRAQPLPCDEVLIINDGSTDGSEQLVRDSGFPYIDLPQNLGCGHSYMIALDWALERGFDVFGAIAGNGKMLPSEMGRLLEPVRSGEAEFVTGSRFLSGGVSPNLPSFRRAAIPVVGRFVKILTGAALTDATCGYRAFHLDLIRRARFDWHARWLYPYGLEYYLYAKVILDGSIRYAEVPVTMRYPERGRPYSKVSPIKGWWAMLQPWLVARIDGKGFAPRTERAQPEGGQGPDVAAG